MIIPDTEREALRSLIRQVRTDNKAMLGDDTWAEWSSMAWTLRWIDEVERKFHLEESK